jgi:phage tail sheath gpL-like
MLQNNRSTNNMSTPNTISIDGTDYVRADSQPAVTGDIQIVVADRGWVFVGAVTNDEAGTTIANARCIRIWGTDNDKPGLGYIAMNGPTSKTKLDASGTVRIPLHALVATFDTDASKWQ